MLGFLNTEKIPNILRTVFDLVNQNLGVIFNMSFAF